MSMLCIIAIHVTLHPLGGQKLAQPQSAALCYLIECDGWIRQDAASKIPISIGGFRLRYAATLEERVLADAQKTCIADI